MINMLPSNNAYDKNQQVKKCKVQRIFITKILLITVPAQDWSK